jgi:hypothetical protein
MNARRDWYEPAASILVDPPFARAGFVIALLLALLLSPFAAHAGNATWVLPTTYADAAATPMPAADIASTTVQYGTCNGNAFGASLGAVNVAAPSTSATIPSLAPGTYCARAFVTTVASKGGLASAFSNVAQATVPFPSPGAPSNFTFTLP